MFAPGRLALLLFLSLALAACQEGASDLVSVPPPAPSPQPPPAPAPPPVGDAAAGRLSFVNDCASCHTSRDGFDLAFFAFDEATILRRAAPHVDETTARNIVAHIRTLEVAAVGRQTRPFQPLGFVLPSDVAFATTLFGADGWPAGLTTADLQGIDPLAVAAAVELPLWSIEGANLDWMPEAPPPDAVLDFGVRGVTPRVAVARYYAQPTTESLVAAVTALRVAERAPENAGAPCVTEPPERFDALACFEARRWTANLVGQHMLRNGLADPVQPALHDTWWDVGNAARQSPRAAVFENREANWAAWMYLGWIFEPDRHASTYLGNGLARIGLARHGTFVALKSEVSRPPRSGAAYADVATAARLAPPGWAFDAVSFGYRHLLERLSAGDVPGMAQAVETRDHVLAAHVAAAPKVSMAERSQLAALRDQVLAALP